MSGFLGDLRFALRQFRTYPAFSLAVVASLALGIGMNTAVFSVVDGVLLRRAPVRDLDRLMIAWETDGASGTVREPASLPDFIDFRDRTRAFQSLEAVLATELNMTPPAGDTVRLASLQVTPGMLPMLGLSPAVGRGFAAGDDRRGGPRIAIISDALWARVFDRRPDVQGQTLRFDDVQYEVIGVAPDAADFGALQVLGRAAYARGFADRGMPARVDVWTPLVSDTEEWPRQTHPLFMIGRLAPGATRAAAQAEFEAINVELSAYPENAGRGVFVEPLDTVVFGPVRPALLVLWAAVAFVLLAACANVANLLLVRATARSREIAIRRSLGSGAGRLVRQFAVETLVLTATATVAGVGLAFAVLGAFVSQAPAALPRLDAVAIDLRVLAATAAISALVAVVFGLVPTLFSLGVDPQTTLKGAGDTRGGSNAGRLRLGLVVAQMALAVVLITGTGLFIRTLWNIQQVDSGFTTAGVIKAEYNLPRSRYPVNFRVFPDFKEQHAFTRALLEQAALMPGVEAAAVVGQHPLDPGFTNSFSIVGRDDERHGEISIRQVTPGYFETVGLGSISGRPLADQDGTAAPAVAVINRTAAERLFPGRSPEGEQIAFWGTRRTIVGVVKDERIHGLTEEVPISVYVPLAQAPSAGGAGVLMVRTAGDPMALAASIRAAITSVDPQLAVFGVEPLDRTVARSIGAERFLARLLGLFAAIALVLVAVGVHGVLSFDVACRTREIGIRMALGANAADVRRGVVRQGLGMAAGGLLFGIAGAVALSRVIGSLLFGVSPADPLTMAATGVVLIGVAAAACILPARRATQIEPARAISEP